MGAFVLIHRNGISGDFERSFEFFHVRCKIRMGVLVLIRRNGISGDFERSLDMFNILGCVSYVVPWHQGTYNT